MNQTYCSCPECGQLRTRVVCTKRTAEGVTIRRRWCASCNHRWYSIQYPEVSVANKEIKWYKSGSQAKFEQSAKTTKPPALGI
tara:strand:+ start:589 stop:837 length:249 start_codon:yes stop_codon:yes gene_type:complete